jgi:LAO/AO transport system kinase
LTRTSVTKLKDRILAGDLRALARAATLVEGQGEPGRALIASLFHRTGRARLVGITGPPGAGKSTLVSELAKVIRSRGKSVGIIAVDPSSPYSRGALLGDRIRMQDHHADPGVFVRSMATRGRLGGLARGTLEMALLLDAAGRDFVLIETVGVGQDEIEIALLADVTVLVLMPGMGDDVQALKAGIMEIASVFAINKADLPGVARLEQEIRAMQSLGDESSRPEAAPVRQVIANQGHGIEELLNVIEQVFEKKDPSALKLAWSFRLREMLRERVDAAISSEAIERHAKLVAEKIEDPYAATEALFAQAVRQNEK